MTGSVTVYFNTGFNGIDIPSSPTVLASASKKTYMDVYYMREDIDKPTIKIKDTYENLCAVDYCAITTGTGTSAATRYFFASPSALSKGVTLLALDLDALLTMGGAENLTYISGWQERGHIKKTDDVLFGNVAAEDWVPSEPLVAQNTTTVKATDSQVADDYDIIISNIDLGAMGQDAGSSKQTCIEGIVNGQTEMVFPKIQPPATTVKTSFTIFDFDENDTHGFSIPQTVAFDANNANVVEGLEKLYSCGQLQLQASYHLPKEYLGNTPTGSSQTGFLSNITGVHETKDLTNIPFEYTENSYTPKNKKVFATFRDISLVNLGSGDMITKTPEELYDGTHSYPSVNIWADPTSTGKPYARFSYIKGSPLQWFDNVKGLQWANSQIVMEGASGSLWNSIDNAFANQQLQRQQSMNIFEAGIAAQNYSLQKTAMDVGLQHSAVDALIGAFSGGAGAVNAHYSRDKKGNPINELSLGSQMASAGFAIASAGNAFSQAMDTNTFQTQMMWNEMQANSSRAEMANNSIQNQINQNNIGLIRSNQVIAPTVSFTPEQNLGLYGYNHFVAYEVRKSYNDLVSEDRYYQRYGYNGLHRPLVQQCFKERTYYNYVQAFDVNLKAPVKEFGLRVRTKAIAQLNKGVRVWRVLPDPQYYETN